MKQSQKIIISFLCVIIFTSCSPKLKLPSSKLEDYIELGKVSNEDIGTKFLLNANNIRITGKTIDMIDEEVKVVLVDKNSKDKITVIFQEGTELKFDLKMKTRVDSNVIHPQFEKIKFESSKPIKFKHNKKRLVELSSIIQNNSSDIAYNIASLSILNIILYVFDHHILTPSHNKYRFNKSISKLPNILLDKIELNFKNIELMQPGYTINITQPFSVNLNNLEIKEDLELVNIGDVNLKLKNSSIHTNEIDFVLDELQLNLTNHQLKLNPKGYSIIKKPNSRAELILRKGKLDGINTAISEGEFDNLKFDLSNYNYKSVTGNSIVDGSINISGKLTQLKNDYHPKRSKLYYVLKPFNLEGFSINYSDSGNGEILRSFQTNKPLKIEFRDLYFQDFGKYEFWSTGVKFSLSPSTFTRIEEVNLDISEGIDFSTTRSLLNIYKGKGHQIEFPKGIKLSFDGLTELKFMSNKVPQFDTIYFQGNLKEGIIRDLKDSTDILSIDNSDLFFKFFKNITGAIDYTGIVTGGKFEPKLPNESKLIAQFLNGSYLTFKSLEIDDKQQKITDLQIRIPKNTVINELEKQLRSSVVKDYGKVHNFVIRFKKRIGPFKFSTKVATIGIHARVNDINLKEFRFMSLNSFEFNLGGSVTIYRERNDIFGEIRETKRIRTARGRGNIEINTGENISDCVITVNTNYLDGEVDIENFPGVLEKGVGEVRQALGRNLNRSLRFMPFENASEEQLRSLKKIKLIGSPTISEESDYFVFTLNALITTK